MKLCGHNEDNIADISTNLGEFWKENGRVISEYRRAIQSALCLFPLSYAAVLKGAGGAVYLMLGLQGISCPPSGQI